MSGTGAPEGNQYAKKADTGKTISLYIKAEDMALLRLILQQYGQEPTSQNCIEQAKKAALSGIYRLLLPMKESEIQDFLSQQAQVNAERVRSDEH